MRFERWHGKWTLCLLLMTTLGMSDGGTIRQDTIAAVENCLARFEINGGAEGRTQTKVSVSAIRENGSRFTVHRRDKFDNYMSISHALAKQARCINNDIAQAILAHGGMAFIEVSTTSVKARNDFGYYVHSSGIAWRFIVWHLSFRRALNPWSF